MQNYLLSDTFYGEIESVDEENGILTIESVASTGYKDHVKSFIRKVCSRSSLIIIVRHMVNFLALNFN